VETNKFFIDRRKKEIKDYIESGYLTDEAKVKLKTEGKFLETINFYNKLKDNLMKAYV